MPHLWNTAITSQYHNTKSLSNILYCTFPNYVFIHRSMSNDLEVLDSPRSVIRTYSNYNRRRTDEQSSASSTRRGEEDTDNLRVVAINNNITKKEREDLEMQMFSSKSISIHIPGKGER